MNRPFCKGLSSLSRAIHRTETGKHVEQLVVKIPISAAAPSEIATSFEVATMKYCEVACTVCNR